MKSQSYAGWTMGAVLAFSALGTSAGAAVPPQDAVFATKAAQAGVAEVQFARLALQRSTNLEVVAFARKMNADHSKANAELTSIVKQKGLTPPDSLGTDNDALKEQLLSESGASFNATYLKSQLPAHRQVLSLFQEEVATGQDHDLVAFAKQTIPTIEEHISLDKREIAKFDSAGRMSMK